MTTQGIEPTSPFASATGSTVANTAIQAAASGPQSFNELLRQITSTPSDTNSAARKKAEDAAAGLVSNALILPILKQIRRSPWGENSVFSGGIGEKTFGPQFDMQLADRIAHSPRLGIKNALADRLMKRTAAKQPSGKELNIHG
jgi:hypothetical protein